jgi:hypothetical protein
MSAAAPDDASGGASKKARACGLFFGLTVGLRPVGGARIAARRLPGDSHGGDIVAIWKSGFD